MFDGSGASAGSSDLAHQRTYLYNASMSRKLLVVVALAFFGAGCVEHGSSTEPVSSTGKLVPYG